MGIFCQKIPRNSIFFLRKTEILIENVCFFPKKTEIINDNFCFCLQKFLGLPGNFQENPIENGSLDAPVKRSQARPQEKSKPKRVARGHLAFQDGKL